MRIKTKIFSVVRRSIGIVTFDYDLSNPVMRIKPDEITTTTDVVWMCT